MSKSTDVLRRVLGSLSDEDVAELNRVAVRRKYPSETIVCHEGEIEHTFYVIESGLVSVTRRLADNSEQVLGILRDGQFFGEMGLLDNVPRAATVRTLTNCTLIEITEETFDTIVARNPSVAVTLLKGISRTLRDTDRIAIAELELRNQELANALENLKAAQAELLKQERLKRDLEIAAAVQQSTLPTSFPSVPGFEFAVQARPAREVGGDFYDVVQTADNQFGIVVADVSGKSVQAAIFMAIVKALLLREMEECLSPAETVHRLHDQLLKTTTADMFVTLFYGVLDAAARQLCFVRAGHERPIHYRAASQSLELLSPPGRFVGLLPGLIVEEATLHMLPGDCLVCFSDGVTDAENEHGEQFSLERLLAIVHARGHLPAAELAAHIMQSVEQFSGDVPQTDDITILVVRATNDAAPETDREGE